MINFISRLVRGASAKEAKAVDSRIDLIAAQLEEQQRLHKRVIKQITTQTQMVQAVTTEMIPEIWREIDGLKVEVSKLKTGQHKKWRAKSKTMQALVYDKLDERKEL